MKTIIVILLINMAGYSQSIVQDYSIYIFLDSSKDEMNVFEKKINDSVTTKTFMFSNVIPEENEKYYLKIDAKGIMNKYVKGNVTHFKDGDVILN